MSPRAKMHNYINLVLATQEVEAQNPDAWPILLDMNGNLCEGPGANIFLVKDGEVLTPGVYELPEGGAIGDLVQLAGGFTNTADVAALDFSLRVRPDERFVIPPRCLNINAATAEQFQSLPGVGPGRAADIVEYRDANGPFAAVENLTDVPGVGAGILANIQAADCITVGE